MSLACGVFFSQLYSLNPAYKHIQMFKLMGYEPPKYAHISPIMKEEDGKYKTDSTLGGWFGYFGDKINDVSEFIGLNAVINNAKNGFNNSMERLGINDTLNKAVDYSKNAGEYVVDKAKEVSQAPMVVEAKEKITHVVDEVKDTAINMIKSASSGNNPNSGNNNEEHIQSI